MTNFLLDTFEKFINYINPAGAKAKEIKELINQSHTDASNIIQRNIKELSSQFVIETAYKVEVRTSDTDTKEDDYYLHLQQYSKLSAIETAFKEGKGQLYLLDLEEKTSILSSTHFITENTMSYKPINTDELIPDFLYILDEEEYCVSLKPIHTTTSKKELHYELQTLYKALYLSLNKTIDIDSDFNTSGCNESEHILRYFRLNQNSLFLVVEDLKGNVHHHTFNNISEIKHATNAITMMKFWIYMHGDSYRFYLPYDKKTFKTTQVPLDQEIFKVII
ncbi:hypothetical protein ACQKFU_06685 [Bacillus mycoides]|uniref:hypothetical protein n=1 Tax=Bacillus mycoides TaxID=1405 RepID=UPI003D024F46